MEAEAVSKGQWQPNMIDTMRDGARAEEVPIPPWDEHEWYPQRLPITQSKQPQRIKPTTKRKIIRPHLSHKANNKGSFMRFCAGRMSLRLQTAAPDPPTSQQAKRRYMKFPSGITRLSWSRGDSTCLRPCLTRGVHSICYQRLQAHFGLILFPLPQTSSSPTPLLPD